jgi:hypothetical protein
MKKLITRIVVGVIVLLILVVLGAWLMIDSIAKKGIEVSGEYALGVPTKVNGVDLSLLGGTLRIDTLDIANPSGFASPHLMKSGTFDLGVRPASVLGGTVELTHFTLDGLDVNIEQKLDRNNVSVVLDHVKKLGGGGEGPAKPEGKEGGRKVKVDTVTVKNVVAHVHLLGGLPVTVNVPTIELHDVGSDGAPTSQIINRIVTAVLAAVIEKGKGVIPSDLAGVLNTDLAAAASAMGGQATKLVSQAKDEALKAVQGAAEKAAETAGKTAEEAKKGLGGLLNKTPGQRK